MPHSSLAIANEFIRRASKTRPLTHMQIQKLVYLSHGWKLGTVHRPLIEDEFEAWDFGPVVRRLYDALTRYGRAPITREVRWGDDTPFRSDDAEIAFAELRPSEADVVELVWQNYGKFPAFQLSALTHKEGSPWAEAYVKGQNRVIRDEKIEEYFEHIAA